MPSVMGQCSKCGQVHQVIPNGFVTEPTCPSPIAEIDHRLKMLSEIMEELEDVPGDDALAKVQRLKNWYQDWCRGVIDGHV